VTHPRIYPYISDDGSPAREDYQPIESDLFWYVVVHDLKAAGPELLGLWMFHPHNVVCWELHTCLLPVAWGDTGLEAMRGVIQWIWQNTPCRRIIGNCPTTNRLALHFAVKAGMKVYGVNEASYLKNGVLSDQVCLGISKPQEQPTGEAETTIDQEKEESCR